MKRPLASASSPSPKKVRSAAIPAVYHLTPSKTNADGQKVWPAPIDQISRARELIQECAATNKRTILVPDKDADGLTSGAILQRTLLELGLDKDNISVYFVNKGSHVGGDIEREDITKLEPAFIFVLDQGSGTAPPLANLPHKGLIIDHHHNSGPTDFPDGSDHVSAWDCPPVVTASLLTYHICSGLSPNIADQTKWLCAIGTHGDLGNSFKWEEPFPDFSTLFKQTGFSKKDINTAVSLLNAPRRTAEYDVHSAWSALTNAASPGDILKSPRLQAARSEVNLQVERHTHTPPQFSSDGRIAFLRISSSFQIHPVIATRWAGHLRSKNLQVVMVANGGYLPGKVNFSCRIAKCAKERGEDVNIIEILEEVAGRSEDLGLRERLGRSFARGHKEASGGIVGEGEFGEFEKLLGLLERAKKGDAAKRRMGDDKASGSQKNTIGNYFRKVA
jgi:hypothetical protein